MSVAYQETRKTIGQQPAARERPNRAILAGLPQVIRSATDAEKALMRAIAHRTGGRIQALRVQIVGSRVILRGWAVSYHAVQLALDLTGRQPPERMGA